VILGGRDHVQDCQGGLALLQARIVLETIGCAIIFEDGADAALKSDYASTFRLLNVQDVMVATNRATAEAFMLILDRMVKMREPELAPGFFITLQSPAVPAYKKQQQDLIDSLKAQAMAPAETPQRDKSTRDLKVNRMRTRKLTECDENGHSEDENGHSEDENADKAGEEKGAYETDGAADGGKDDQKATPRKGVRFNVATVQADELKEASGASSFRRQLVRSNTRRRLDLAENSVKSENSMKGLERDQMKCLALIAHNNMKDEMRKFVEGNKEILKHFRLTGTASTMKMLRTVLGVDDLGGFECSSGPLGGDAQVGAYICLEQVGGVIFFTDPLSAHPHQHDVDFLIRVVNQNNVLHATNPSGAHALVTLFKRALKKGDPSLIPSFITKSSGDIFFREVSVMVKARRWAERAKLRAAAAHAHRRRLVVTSLAVPTLVLMAVGAARRLRA